MYNKKENCDITGNRNGRNVYDERLPEKRHLRRRRRNRRQLRAKVLHRPKQPQHILQRAIHFLLIFRILHGWRQRKALRINGHL